MLYARKFMGLAVMMTGTVALISAQGTIIPGIITANTAQNQ